MSAHNRCLMCGNPAMRPEANFCLLCVAEVLSTADPEIVEASIQKHDDLPEFSAWLRAIRDGRSA